MLARLGFVVALAAVSGISVVSCKRESAPHCFDAYYLPSGVPACVCGEDAANGNLGGELELDGERDACDASEGEHTLCCSTPYLCTCQEVKCAQGVDACECSWWSFVAEDPEASLVDSCTAPVGGHCCKFEGSCLCSEATCTGAVEVAACDEVDVGCNNRERVDDCAGAQGVTGGGSPTPGGADGCIAFRQTDECAADGPPQPCSDRACTDEIPADVSGYCECGDRRVDLDCGHPVVSCEASCGAFTGDDECVAWRHTGDYRADGPRQPENDRACNSWIAIDWSGFCECKDADVPFDSYHAPFSCGTVCAGIAVDPSHCEPMGGGGGGGGGGCTGNSDCGDCERCELSTGNCLPKLSC